MEKERVVIGIDPGTRVTGYGILRVTGNHLQPLDFGCIRPRAEMLLSDRYSVIYSSLLELIDKFSATEMAIETPFVQKNAQSAIKLGIALGCALLAAKAKKCRAFGYSPREVKCNIVGTGKASKEQMQLTIMRYLSLKSAPKPHDAADALGVALCHVKSDSLFDLGKKSKKEL